MSDNPPRDLQTAIAEFELGPMRSRAELRLTPEGILAVGAMVGGILLSTAVVVWAATAVVFLFFGVRAITEPAMGGYPFLMFFPAIIFIALAFDRGTGLFSVVLSAGLAWWFFIPPRGTFGVENINTLWPLVIYVVTGLFLTLVIEALRATAERLQKTKQALEKAATLNELLLVDINHRVKNHLAAVTGLLRLSQREIAEPLARSALSEAARRIDVLGKVYTRLHLGEKATVVSSKEFLISLSTICGSASSESGRSPCAAARTTPTCPPTWRCRSA